MMCVRDMSFEKLGRRHGRLTSDDECENADGIDGTGGGAIESDRWRENEADDESEWSELERARVKNCPIDDADGDGGGESLGKAELGATGSLGIEWAESNAGRRVAGRNGGDTEVCTTPHEHGAGPSTTGSQRTMAGGG